MANNLEIEKIKHVQDQRVSEMKLLFFTNVSHEFRTPLTLIYAPLKELIQKAHTYNIQDEVLDKIKVIYNNTNKLMKLINQLLDFTKAETENLKLVARYLNLEDFIREACYPFYELAKIKEIKFLIDSTLKIKEIWFDRDKMEIIINNLISNALKFNKTAGIVMVTLEENENEVILKIADSGRGIPPTAIDHIFERFYQVDNSENIGSTGIGLTLVKYLVELHKGIIEVESQPGKGTEFRVKLKKGKEHLTPEQIFEDETSTYTFVRDELTRNRFFPSGQKKQIASDVCILIIEDNPEVNQYLVNLLEPFYCVVPASNGLEGFGKAVDLIPDLIISDIMMPEMDGFELCKKVKSNSLTAMIPVILLTAKSADQYKLMGIQTGADDYISKPFDPGYLIEKIRVLLLSQKKMKKQYSKSIRLEPSDIEIESSDEVFLKKCISTIEKNLQNSDFSTEIFAATLNLSSSTLYRKLKSLTNLSSAEFIRSIRIKRAAQLLQDKNKTVSEVAYKVGFNDLKNFRQVFHNQFNCSPTEFRKNNISWPDFDNITSI
jgi:DNA-binding response OmpR family regulator